jgi:hypothetical protein
MPETRVLYADDKEEKYLFKFIYRQYLQILHFAKKEKDRVINLEYI